MELLAYSRQGGQIGVGPDNVDIVFNIIFNIIVFNIHICTFCDIISFTKSKVKLVAASAHLS